MAVANLAEAGIEPSVGSVGDSYDNALAETINGLYKADMIHRRRWPSRAAVEMATLAWVDWYNHRRLLERKLAEFPREHGVGLQRDLTDESYPRTPLTALERIRWSRVSSLPAQFYA